MSKYATPRLEQVLKSRAYKRMKEANPDEFEPKTIYFATYSEAGKSIDWQNCFPLKAAFVYQAITGKKYADVTTKDAACDLLADIARKCNSLIEEAREVSKKRPSGTSPGPNRTQGTQSEAHEDSKKGPSGPSPGPNPTQGTQSEGHEDSKKGPSGPSPGPNPTQGTQPEAREDSKKGPSGPSPGPSPQEPNQGLLKIQRQLQPSGPSPGPSQTQQTPQQKREKGIPDLLGRLTDEDCKIVDGIFLVVVFLSKLKDVKREEADVPTGCEEIEKDIIKIENQLSLKLIQHVVENVGNAIENLQKEKKVDGYKLSFGQDEFTKFISRFCLYYSPVYYTELKKLEADVLKKETLLECLHFSLEGEKTKRDASGGVWRRPSARQLKQCGVRFQVSPASTIDFRFSEPNLQMPALLYDFKMETVLKNLLAWECFLEQKPVTRYLQFMSGLVGDVGDVRVLKKSGLIKGRWKNFREVLDLMKRIHGSASYLCLYMVPGEEDKLWQYYDKRMKSFLVRNRPAVLWFSSVAAASVIATAIYASRRRRQE